MSYSSCHTTCRVSLYVRPFCRFQNNNTFYMLIKWKSSQDCVRQLSLNIKSTEYTPPAPHGTLSYLRIGIWMPKPPLLHSYLAQLGSSSPSGCGWVIFTFNSYNHCKVTEKFARKSPRFPLPMGWISSSVSCDFYFEAFTESSRISTAEGPVDPILRP